MTTVKINGLKVQVLENHIIVNGNKLDKPCENGNISITNGKIMYGGFTLKGSEWVKSEGIFKKIINIFF